MSNETGSSTSNEAVVRAAVEAAESVIFSRYRRSEIRDVDVTIRFDDGLLDVDVYLNVPEADEADQERVADDAALAARSAVDDRLE